VLFLTIGVIFARAIRESRAAPHIDSP
jgi:hypothetical protein